MSTYDSYKGRSDRDEYPEEEDRGPTCWSEHRAIAGTPGRCRCCGYQEQQPPEPAVEKPALKGAA